MDGLAVDGAVEVAAVEVAKIPEPIRKRDKSGRLTEAYILSRHPNVVPESLRWNHEAGKQAVTIECANCGAEREVFTSDLFQVRLCAACTKAARKSRAKAMKAAAKAAIATKVEAVAEIAEIAQS